MKKAFFILFVLIFPICIHCQFVEIEGMLRVSQMDTINTENHLVVKRPDGTLATRMVASLPPPPDTSRTLQSDLVLTSLLCNCGDLPAAMITSLLDNGYSNLDLVGFGVTIQNLLDRGQTPSDLYNDGIPQDSMIGKLYQGGLIFYLDSSASTGLVAATTYVRDNDVWGCYNFDVPGAEGKDIGDGLQNTIAIVNNCSGTPAHACVSWTHNGYSDWFMPSINELQEMYLRIGRGASGQNYDIGNFGSFEHWSSTEENSLYAHWLDFQNGNLSTEVKSSGAFVRAIRSF